MIDLSKLERIPYRAPGPQTGELLRRLGQGKRFVAQGSIPLGPGGFCSWCNIAPVKPPLRKYCDAVCRSSADIHTYPQSPSTKAFVFIERQDCVCLACGEDFGDELAKILERWDSWLADMHREGWHKQRRLVSYFLLGSNCGDRWQVDHRVPISEGGAGVGLENIQVICAGCHTKKSAGENSERLKRLYREGNAALEGPPHADVARGAARPGKTTPTS